MGFMDLTPGMDNVVVALGQNNRVREVVLCGLANSKLEKVLDKDFEGAMSVQGGLGFWMSGFDICASCLQLSHTR